MDIYYVNGKFIPANEAVISVNDLSILRGYGVFDFLRTYKGIPFYLNDHIMRFAESAKMIGITLPWSTNKLVELVIKTLNKNAHKEANIRIVATGGISTDCTIPDSNPGLIIMVSKVLKQPDWWYTKGIKIITTGCERFLPSAKSINYIPAIIALQKAYERNAVESVYVDRKENVLEGTTSNIFAFIGEDLVTPGGSVLPGITRDVVIKLAKKYFDVKIQNISLKDLFEAKEVFITSSTKEVVPVVGIDEVLIGDGKPGFGTKNIMEAFADMVYGE